MATRADAMNLTPANPEDPLRFDLLCGVPSLAESFITRLEGQGLRFDEDAPIKLILDTPRGFTLHTLEALSKSRGRRSFRLIAATLSSCVEYWEDLWDLHPDILIVDASYEYALAEAIRRASRGERYRLSPPGKTTLNRTERKVLSLTAKGLSTKQIAEQLAIQTKTVENSLTRIYAKLGIRNRMELTKYYWGVWHAFPTP